MGLLAVATQELSDSYDQPQDQKLDLDLDFYEQIESMTDEFMVGIRRVELQKKQQEQAIFNILAKQEAIDQENLKKIGEKLAVLHE